MDKLSLASAWKADMDLLQQTRLRSSANPSSSLEVPQTTQHSVGWGGQVRIVRFRSAVLKHRIFVQAISESKSSVPWFGRGRTHNRPRGGRGGFEAGALGAGGGSYGALSVEDLVSMIPKTPRRDPLPEAVFKALHHLDSRALALLLKVKIPFPFCAESPCDLSLRLSRRCPLTIAWNWPSSCRPCLHTLPMMRRRFERVTRR